LNIGRMLSWFVTDEKTALATVAPYQHVQSMRDEDAVDGIKYKDGVLNSVEITLKVCTAVQQMTDIGLLYCTQHTEGPIKTPEECVSKAW
jgi:hypothetical protein